MSTFSGCIKLKSVIIPSSIDEIGPHAFSGCEALVSVSIPSSVSAISEYAFANCSKLESVSLVMPSQLNTIGDYAFSGCSQLNSFLITDKLKSIGTHTFSGCTSLDAKTSFNWLNMIAKQGDPEIQYNLGLHYMYGIGMEQKNMYWAVVWFHRAAEKQHVEAQYLLGRCYADGAGVEINVTEAIQWLLKAAEQEHVEAQFRLGLVYESKEKKVKEAVKWYRKAARAGFPLAQYALARCFFEGKDMEIGEEAAAELCRSAAEQGCLDAQVLLGMLCVNENKIPEAIQWLESAANQGNALAQLYLARIFLDTSDGFNVDWIYKDKEKAIKWLSAAAAAEDPPDVLTGLSASTFAQVILGWIYRTDYAGEKDVKKAVSFFEKAANKHDIGAMIQLGLTYLNEFPDEKYVKKAKELFLKVERMNDVQTQPEVQYYLAKCCEREDELEEAISWYKKSAERKYTNALFDLVSFYYRNYLFNKKGIGDQTFDLETWLIEKVNENNNYKPMAQYCLGAYYDILNKSEEAVKLFQEAEKQGLAEGQSAIGFYHLTGKGNVLEKDLMKARELFHEAVNKKYYPAAYLLGYSYYLCEDENDRNMREAARWFKMAADHKIPKAQAYLGLCYANGHGVEMDAQKAFSWFKTSADQKEPLGQFNLGKCYYDAIGTSKDDTMAITWFRKAADQGLAEAQYYVGLCFELGTGVNQDYLEAAKWFSLAAQQNLPEAQYMLGVFSEEGLVKKPDLSEALDWYYEAAAGGYEPAKQTLKRFKVYTPNWFERLFGLY